MKQIIQILGATILMTLLVAACGLLGSDSDDNDDEPIQIRISNQTGFDFEWYRFRISIGDSNAFERFEFEFHELPDDEESEYFPIPVIAENIVGYSIRLTYFSEDIGFSLDLAIPTYYDYNDFYDFERAPSITSGNYTYILEYTSRDFVFYTISQDVVNNDDDEVRIRVRNAGERDYQQVSVWLRDDEDFMGREFEIGPVAASQHSNYYTVEDALQFTRIQVVTAEGDTVDNEPLTHFGTELPPGDYTYHVEVLTDDLHDNSRIVKD